MTEQTKKAPGMRMLSARNAAKPPCKRRAYTAARPRRQAHIAFVGLILLLGQQTVQAHDGQPHNWHDLIRAWSFEPVVVVSLIVTAWLFIRGVRHLWREAGRDRGVHTWEVVCFVGGWLALFIALVSPLHSWGRVLFSAHMSQHEVLMLVAAPLLVLGRPLVAFLWSMPVSWARVLGNIGKGKWLQTVWQTLTIPFVAWLIHAVALWIWHVPQFFDAVLHSELLHTLQHTSFLFSALLFWWALIRGRRGLMGYGAAALYVFTTSLHSGLLGAFLTFSGTVWFPSYLGLTTSWGLTPLEDQQLGGLIMWIPAGVVYVIAGLALFAGWLREAQVRVEKREQAGAVVIRTV